MSSLTRSQASVVLNVDPGARVRRAQASVVLNADRGLRIRRAQVSVVVSVNAPTPVTEPVNAFILPA